MNHSGNPLLSVENLGVRFPVPSGDIQALDGINLTLEKGRTLGVVGESGSGKSVLSRAIMRLLPPSAHWTPGSRILFGGEDLLNLDRKAMQRIRGQRIAMIFQDPMTALNPVKTIGAQLIEGMRLHLGLSKKGACEKAVRILVQVGIPSPRARLDQFPHELSGGMRQRIVIAMAIACEPDLLIADEPTTALDVTVQADILDLLSRLRQEHDMAMILITHDLGVAAHHCDEIAVMYAGQLVEQAETHDLFRGPRMPYTQALLGSIPRLSDPAHSRLETIPGRPSSRLAGSIGCAFEPRCTRRIAQCREQTPSPHSSDGRTYRCHNPVEA